jgi:hypothetical protein
MNMFTRLCYRVGLACGAIALIAALALIPTELGSPVLAGVRDIAERLFSVFGLAFMWIGLVLLLAAIVWLKKAWPQLSDTAKMVSILGLLAGSFASAYAFHWLFPKVLGAKARA